MIEFKIQITSPPDREKLVAEIWQGDQLLAEINQENENLELEIYSSSKGKWNLRYDEFLETLKRAREELVRK